MSCDHQNTKDWTLGSTPSTMDPSTSVPSLINKLNKILNITPSNATPILLDQLNSNTEIQQSIIFKIVSIFFSWKVQVKESLTAVWNIKGDNKTTTLRREYVQGSLPDKSEFWMYHVKWIMAVREWVDCDGTLLAKYPTSESYKFENCEFWIQLHHISWDMLKEEVTTYIAKDLGSIALINHLGVEK